VSSNIKPDRFNLELSPAAKQRIQRLREVTDAHSLSEVVRRALATYDCLWEEKMRGGVVLIRLPSGHEKELLLP